MIEATREQDAYCDGLALRFRQVQVLPPTVEGGSVQVFCNEPAQYAYPRNGSTESPGLVCVASCTVDANGKPSWLATNS